MFYNSDASSEYHNRSPLSCTEWLFELLTYLTTMLIVIQPPVLTITHHDKDIPYNSNVILDVMTGITYIISQYGAYDEGWTFVFLLDGNL